MNTENEKIHFQTPPNASAQRSIKVQDSIQTPINRHTPILMFDKKRRRFRFSFRKCIMPLLGILFAFLLILGYIEQKLAPQMPALAESAAKKHLYETINSAVEDFADNGLLQYDSMVKTRRDEIGQVIYLEVNTSLLNKAKSILIRRIDESLEEHSKIKISVPLGAITKSNLLSGRGYPVTVRISPVSMTEGEIFTVLEDCGINQTRHLIQVKIRANLMLFFSGETKEIETEIILPIGERVLVGDVPEIYLDNIGGT
jgi:sporulation protein YunB